MLGNKSRDFWAEVRKMTGKSAETSTTVDGVSEPDKIAELFASKYQTLYSSVAYSTSDMDRIKHCIHTVLLTFPLAKILLSAWAIC